jgi:homopolymeric O-antigen transport system permease protein
VSLIERTALEGDERLASGGGEGDEQLVLDDRVTVIRPASRLPRLDVGELWRYRELAATFVWRDFKVRYKQTAIGVAWALLQPFVTMVVMTLVFGKFAQFPSQNLPYPVFLYSAQLPWTYFATALAAASASLAMNAGLVTKIYFPRVLLPLGAIIVPAVDFLIASVILVGMIFYYDVPVGPQAALAPLFLLMAAATALGVGLLFAVVNVRYRDVPYVIPFLIQIWFFVSGVVFPIDALREQWQWILALNPMAGMIAGFRWAIVSTPAPQPGQFALSVAMALVLLVGGFCVFRSAEPRFADTI